MSLELAPGFGLFVGTYNGLFYQKTGGTEFQEIRLPASGIGLINKRVMALEFDGKLLWIGLRDGGVLCYDVANDKFLVTPDSLQRLSVTTIQQFPNNELFIGTYGDGLWILSKGSRGRSEVSRIAHLPELRNVTVVNNISEYTSFVAAEFKLTFLCKNSLEWTTCIDREGLHSANSRVLSASVDKASEQLWIGTQNDGLYRYNLSLGAEWKGDRIDLGSHNNESIFSILRTNDGILWFATSNGLVSYSPSERSKTVYFAQDGLQDNDFNYGAALKTNDGRLFFGGSNGFNFLDATQFKIERSIPEVHFRHVQLGSDELSVLYKYNSEDRVELGYFDYFIRIFFHVPDYINSLSVKYRYKLHPFDPTWIDGGNDGSATYTNIPPGDYVFHVQGANSAGVWNREGITMNIRVLPPAWQTWWAYCLYAIGIYFALLMGKKWYDSNVLREKANEIAREKTLAADAALDDMQEQLEAQDSLVRNVRQRNIATLERVGDIVLHRADYLSDDVSAEIMRGSGRHIHALALLEKSLKYYNDRLVADLNAFTADCLAELCQEHDAAHDVTTINEVSDKLIHAEDATLIAIVIHELLVNAFLHAFNEHVGNKYLRVLMKCHQKKVGGPMQVELKVQDNGSGIPEGVAGELPGLSLARKIAAHYNGKMQTSAGAGAVITIRLEIPAPVNG